MNNPVLYNVTIKNDSTYIDAINYCVEQLIDDCWKEHFRLYLKEIVEGHHRPEIRCVLAVNEDTNHTDRLENFVELGMAMQRFYFYVIYIYPGEEYNPLIDLTDKEAFLIKPNTNEE